MNGQLNWFKGGLLLGAAFLLAVAFVKPIGVSTQFVIADGIVWNLFSDTVVQKAPESKSGYASPNAYLNKSGGKYAKNVANPLNYSFVFVIAMVVGGVFVLAFRRPQTHDAGSKRPRSLATALRGESHIALRDGVFCRVARAFRCPPGWGLHQRPHDEWDDADIPERLPVRHRCICGSRSRSRTGLQKKIGGAL